ncbi:ABC transporter permease [Clostridium intestinale]|uniref:ABC transporter permease n=1 Tax=Clostridium intestinale TaxID=36845 RepID=A0A7D6ZYU0_9CLOT|nr:ABC transporter permease [Clostridium intestinale]QLY78915.1 ABC transporter permease [Clostridium intestinale]
MKIIQYSFMHLQRILKDKKILLLGMLMPTLVVSLVVFFTNKNENVSSSNIYVDVVNQDTGLKGEELINELEDTGVINLTKVTLEDGERRVKSGNSSFAIIIPEKFSSALEQSDSESTEVSILKLSQGNVDNIVSNKINSFIMNNTLATKVVNNINSDNSEKLKNKLINNIQDSKIKVEKSTFSTEEKTKTVNIAFLGVMISFMMYTMIYFVNEIMEIKRNGTLRRSISTPNSNITIGGALLLSFLVTEWIQVAVMVGFTKIVFKVNWGNSYAALFLVFTAFILVILSLGLLLSRWIKNETQSAIVVNMVATLTGAVSGCFVSVEYLPGIFQKIASFTPQNWVLNALTEVMLNNKGIYSVLPSIGILLLFAAAFFTAAASSLRTVAQN